MEENEIIYKNPTRALKFPRKIKPIPKAVSGDDQRNKEKEIQCPQLQAWLCNKVN